MAQNSHQHLDHGSRVAAIVSGDSNVVLGLAESTRLARFSDHVPVWIGPRVLGADQVHL